MDDAAAAPEALPVNTWTILVSVDGQRTPVTDREALIADLRTKNAEAQAVPPEPEPAPEPLPEPLGDTPQPKPDEAAK